MQVYQSLRLEQYGKVNVPTSTPYYRAISRMQSRMSSVAYYSNKQLARRRSFKVQIGVSFGSARSSAPRRVVATKSPALASFHILVETCFTSSPTILSWSSLHNPISHFCTRCRHRVSFAEIFIAFSRRKTLRRTLKPFMQGGWSPRKPLVSCIYNTGHMASSVRPKARLACFHGA